MKKLNITFILALFLALTLLNACGKASSENDLTNNPSIESVKEAIANIDTITLIEVVTEDNDPNGQLGKQGGYTGQLYFKSSLVTDETDESAIEAGTDGGGSIEVYANESDAIKRNEYLAGFDGTALSSGSHKVLGTLVIRTSDKLKASQQTILETNIINALLTGGGIETEMIKETPQNEEEIEELLQLDKKEKRGRITYSVSSLWKTRSHGEESSVYLPYDSDEDGAFFCQILDEDDELLITSKEDINASLEKYKEILGSIYDDFNFIGQRDINGIPIMEFEATMVDSDKFYIINGYCIVYGDKSYFLNTLYPESADSQFFSSTLSQIIDSLTIEKYTQSELAPSNVGDIGNYYVEIQEATLTKDYNGAPAIVVDFLFANNAETAESFIFSTHVTAYQDGVELDSATIMNESVYDSGLGLKKVKPGVSLVVQSAFILSSDSPVEIEVKELFSFSNDTVLTKTFNKQ